MDSNHDIVPTLRMMGGVMVELAADEIDRLRSQVARLGRMADTGMIPGSEPTHRCKVCGAYWRKWNVDGCVSWNLNSHGCGECCDNAAMGDQIEALTSPAKVGGDEREAFEWPPFPELPRQWASATCPVYTSAQMQTYAKTYGDAVRAALSAHAGEDKRDAERYRGLVKHFTNEDAAGWLRIVFETSRQGKDHPPEGRKQWFDADIDGELAAIAANQMKGIVT